MEPCHIFFCIWPDPALGSFFYQCIKIHSYMSGYWSDKFRKPKVVLDLIDCQLYIMKSIQTILKSIVLVHTCSFVSTGPTAGPWDPLTPGAPLSPCMPRGPGVPGGPSIPGWPRLPSRPLFPDSPGLPILTGNEVADQINITKLQQFLMVKGSVWTHLSFSARFSHITL